MATREEGQSLASADALARYMMFVEDLSIAQSDIYQCKRALLAAKKLLAHAQEAEKAALRAYEAVPYGEAAS